MGSGFRSVVAALGGLVATVVVAVVPSVYFAYRAPVMRAVLETAVTLVGALIAMLCIGRYRRHRRQGDLAIACAVMLLALAYLLLGVVPRAVVPGLGDRIGMWAPLFARILAAAVLACASTLTLSGPWSTRAPRLGWAAVLAVGGTVAGVVATLAAIAPDETVGFLRPELSEAPRLFANPLVAFIQLGAGMLFAVAAARLSLAAGKRRDPFLGWLGAGCALAAVAGLDYALFPSLNPNWLHTGDLLRAGAVVAWAVGAGEEIASYWSEIGSLARAEERRRIARDLHDGLAQELAFVVSHAHAPSAARADPEWLARLQAAAGRSLAESRRAIAALVADSRVPLETDLRRVAQQVAGRGGASVDVDVTGAPMSPDRQELVVRIVREAVTNATRHGGARHITIQFRDASRPTLRISDDGAGFNSAWVADGPGGFGLISMRERADALGATMAVRSARGQGTTVEFAWP